MVEIYGDERDGDWGGRVEWEKMRERERERVGREEGERRGGVGQREGWKGRVTKERGLEEQREWRGREGGEGKGEIVGGGRREGCEGEDEETMCY